MNRRVGRCRELEPREGGEVESTKVCAQMTQRETGEFWKAAFENGVVKFHVPTGGIGLVRDLEVLQPWYGSRELC